jgi:hypothetical protein
MTFESHWCVPGRVVFIRYHDEITLEDYRGVAKTMLEAFEEGSPLPVHNIVDYTYMKAMPDTISGGAKALSHITDPRYGWSVVVHAGNPLVKMRTAIMLQVKGDHFTSVETVQDAVEFLNEADDTLAGLEWVLPTD